MKGLKCAVYLAVTGVSAFVLGRVLPKRLFHPDRFPYRAAPFEREGRIYGLFGVQKWQNRVPDMSRVFPRLMPPKDLSGDIRKRLPEMLRETCVAELIHWLVGAAGFVCVGIWPGAGGWIFAGVNLLLLNLPYIVIQRYNRPRLMRLQQRYEKREAGEAAKA